MRFRTSGTWVRRADSWKTQGNAEGTNRRFPAVIRSGVRPARALASPEALTRSRKVHEAAQGRPGTVRAKGNVS